MARWRWCISDDSSAAQHLNATATLRAVQARSEGITVTVRAIRVGDHVRADDGTEGIVTQWSPWGLSTIRRDDGVTGGGFERGWLIASYSAARLPREPGDPPMRYGPYKPIPKALP
jgi:hypothetical protein